MAVRKDRERISDRAHKSEAEIAQVHLSAFRSEGSAGLVFLQELCPAHSLTRESLIVVAKLFSIISGIHFPRDYTRRRDLIFKWFTDHIAELEAIGRLFTLEAENIQIRDESAFAPALRASAINC
jgi:hypothetical protein